MLRVPPAPAPMRVGGLDHGADHLGVLAHAEIVVGAPHDDFAFALGGVPDRMGKPAGEAFEIGKHPIAPFTVQLGEGIGEVRCIIHCGGSPRP